LARATRCGNEVYLIFQKNPNKKDTKDPRGRGLRTGNSNPLLQSEASSNRRNRKRGAQPWSLIPPREFLEKGLGEVVWDGSNEDKGEEGFERRAGGKEAFSSPDTRLSNSVKLV